MKYDPDDLQVYRNLNKPGYFSVRAKVNGRWKVIEHVREISLIDVRFYVSEAGRQRVLRTKRRNVHAWVVGKRSTKHLIDGGPISYNPYKSANFTDSDGKPRLTADAVVLWDSKVWEACLFDWWDE